jgi:two-component system sensor histidine kinase YesM
MNKAERWIQKSKALASLHRRILTAQTVLFALMLIPAVVSICLMMIFSSQYHAVILHMEKVSLLRPMIQDGLLFSVSEIVVGRTQFEEGRQYEYLDAAQEQLDLLISGSASSRMELTVAQRTLGTLRRNVDILGEQILNEWTVDENMRQAEEIRNVASLFLEMLQDSIYADIRAAGVASHSMQSVVSTTLLTEVALLLVSLTFALLSERWLSRSIRAPIDRLKLLAGRIASGALKERAEAPDVEELKDLTHSLNTMAEKLEALIQENTREQQNLKKSELRALQAQITPHFLYNTLDAIIWLAESKRTDEVVQITSALSNFYRTSLSDGKDWISIQEEKEHLLGYTTILHVRYRDILRFDMEIDEGLSECRILKLLIQPLVENAVYHGIKNKRGGGVVRVSIGKQDQVIHVEVRDNGAGMPPERLAEVRWALAESEALPSESGYGLLSVDKRIRLYYNQGDGLEIDSRSGEGTTVRFSVPVRGLSGV